MQENDNLVIETCDLGKTYQGQTALKSLNLRVPRHSIFGFLGPNGAGKTTTIKLLLGLTRPSRGGGTIFGRDIAADSVEIRRRVGYLAQDPRYYEYMTARETLRFTAGFFFSGPRGGVEARVAETLELVGLQDKADRPIRGFSGGERQRLGIAQAQVNHPDLLILDEPAAALDPQGRHDVLTIMEKLRGRTTIFYSTHILEDVQRVSDAVAILDRGELVAQAPIQDLLAGNGEIVYTFQTRGDAGGLAALLTAQAWVSSVKDERADGRVLWRVSVTDADAAEEHLMRLAAGVPGLRVADFNREKMNLEEAFLAIVRGEKQGRG